MEISITNIYVLSNKAKAIVIIQENLQKRNILHCNYGDRSDSSHTATPMKDQSGPTDVLQTRAPPNKALSILARLFR